MKEQDTMEQGKYTPSHIWVSSLVEGVGKSWYYGGCDEFALSAIQPLLDKFNACICYGDEFYNNVDDVPFKRNILPYCTYGMPTGYIETNPTVTVVPKGTRFDDSPHCKYLGIKRFVFPNSK